MNRFKGPKCKGNQYSAIPNENTPCVYCGNPTVRRMQTLDEDEVEERNDEKNE